MLDLDKKEKNMMILTMIMTSVNRDTMTSRSKKKNEERLKTRMMDFYFENKKICRDTFMYLFGVSKNLLYALKMHYLENGLSPRCSRHSKFSFIYWYILCCQNVLK